MGTWKRWTTILVATIVALGAVALLLPATSFAGFGETPQEHWVRRPDLDGQCSGGTQCYQMCIDFQGDDHPMPNYECF